MEIVHKAKEGELIEVIKIMPCLDRKDAGAWAKKHEKWAAGGAGKLQRYFAGEVGRKADALSYFGFQLPDFKFR